MCRSSLLDGMRQLMCEETASLRVPWEVAPGAKIDVRAVGKSLSVEGAGGLRGTAVIMQADVAQISGEARFKAGAERFGQRLAASAGTSKVGLKLWRNAWRGHAASS